jgi:hypothetical protein
MELTAVFWLNHERMPTGWITVVVIGVDVSTRHVNDFGKVEFLPLTFSLWRKDTIVTSGIKKAMVAQCFFTWGIM